MKRQMKKIISLLLAAIMLCFALTACSNEIRIDTTMDKNILLNVGGTTCSTQEAIFRLFEERAQYEAIDNELLWKRDLGGETMADYIKSAVKYEMTRNTTCMLMADSLALYLNEDQETEAAMKAQEAYDKMSARFDLSKYNITLTDVQNLYYKEQVYQMLYEELSKDLSLEISESDTKVIQVSYVFIPGQENYEAAEALRAKINGGEGFEYSCEQAGYEPVLNKTIMRGDMPESFERVAYALIDGEMSEVVEDGKNGYYLILCIEDYLVAESTANKNKIISEAKKEVFDKEYAAFTAKKKLQFNSGVWDAIDVEGL